MELDYDVYVKSLQETIRSVKENREMERSFMTKEEIRREGVEEGRIVERREMILECLQELASEDASDMLMEELKARIASETDLNLLKKMTRLVIEATSAEEFKRNISNL